MADDSSIVQGYRYDPKTGGLESTPKKFDYHAMSGNLEALRNAAKLGVPIPSPEYIGAMGLLEGRTDFGYNKFDTNNKRAVALYHTLQGDPYYHTPKQAGFAAAILANQDLANHFNMPLSKIWNGTGKSKRTGLTGDDYAKSHQATMDNALSDPKNQKYMDFIRKNLTSPAPQTPSQPAQAPAPAPEKSWWQKLFSENQPQQADGITLPDDYSPGGRERLI
jgi:hypothetical protein